MTDEIENQVKASVEQCEMKFRKLAIKLASLILSGWMIVGSTALGILLPAYVVAKVMRIEWTRSAEAGIERAEQGKREPKITVSEHVYQQSLRQMNYSKPNESKVSVASGMRTMTNTLNEARYFVKSAEALGAR